MPLLLPAMCLNRHYVAEGVRVFSQESWKLCFGTTGRQRVAQHIGAVVPYYTSQSKVRALPCPVLSCRSRPALFCPSGRGNSQS